MPTLAQLRSGRTSDSAPQLGFAFEEPEATPQPAEPAARQAPRRTTFSVAELVSLIPAVPS